MKELMFLKELILVGQINQKNVCFVIIGILKTLVINFNKVCNVCRLSMIVYDLDDFMILSIKGVDYKYFVFKMSKNDAIKLLNNSCVDNKDIL